jgi:hypothetical protein
MNGPKEAKVYVDGQPFQTSVLGLLKWSGVNTTPGVWGMTPDPTEKR